MCPDRDILSASIDGEIGSPWQEAIEAHLAACADCRALVEGMQATRRTLQREEQPDWRGPMERVRRGILAHATARLASVSLWRRRLTVPLPVAVAAAALIVCIGAALIMVSVRSTVGHVRITKAPAGGTEIQISAPIGDLESLLRSVGGEDPTQEEIIALPKNVRLLPVGEPRMGKAAEFPRNSTW
jgi:predicted anti-sigma-YlaC factor YlaD